MKLRLSVTWLLYLSLDKCRGGGEFAIYECGVGGGTGGAEGAARPIDVESGDL